MSTEAECVIAEESSCVLPPLLCSNALINYSNEVTSDASKCVVRFTDNQRFPVHSPRTISAPAAVTF